MADEIETHTVQPDRPARPDAETRQETIERVVDESSQVQEIPATRQVEDPTSRRGVNSAVTKRALAAAGLGAVVGAVLGVVLSFLPGPFETSSAGGTIGYAAVMAILIAIVVGLIATLVLLAREDGRVEREVERTTGREPEAPGSPSAPEHDIPGG